MTDKAERRKFLKAALAALATTAGVSGCRKETMAFCYSMPAPIDPKPKSVADPENPTSPDVEEDE